MPEEVSRSRDPAPIPDKLRRYLAWGGGLTALIVGFLLWTNAHYFFHAKLFEEGDPGANSLSVLRAEHFRELYGAYSRWGFRHPGPALFYAYALGETLFYRVLGLVPTPYNAQLITALLLDAAFFAAGITVAARWVRSRVFVPLAFLVAVLHFTAVDVSTCLLSPWTACVLAMPFFALLLAGASVGAGQGDDLPLLTLAGGFAVHLHIAQPLFVGPFCVLAYTGLLWSCVRRGPASSALMEGRDAPRPGRALPWRVFPRAHGFAAVLAGLFLLPPVVDLFLAPDNNLSHVLRHMHAYHGQRQPWLDSVYSFLQFGVYKPSRHIEQSAPGNVGAALMGRFIVGHVKMTLLWSGALLAPLAALALRRFWPAPSPAPGTDSPAGFPRAVWRWRLLGWLAVFWLLSVGLTVVWGHIQDGEMLYFNSWFTYVVYYTLALLAVIAVCDMVETAASRLRHPARWTTALAVLCALLAGTYVARHPGRYSTNQYDTELARTGAQTVVKALAAPANGTHAKLLVFPLSGWGVATGIATQLTRLGIPCLVLPEWRFMFGDDHAPADLLSRLATDRFSDVPFDLWRIVPANSVAPEVAARYPLIQNYALLPGSPELAPADQPAITFSWAGGNFTLYAVTGWGGGPGPGDVSAWSTGQTALLSFVPRPVPPDATVEIDFHFNAVYLAPGKRDVQRLTMRFNGTDIGAFDAKIDAPATFKAFVPAALWNQRAGPAMLAIRFPDAISPAEAHGSGDTRELAFNTESITFREIAAPAGN